MTIKDICAHFDIGGKYIGCEEIVSGNINSTFRVRFVRDGKNKSYILQRINKSVFKEPEKVMDNIVRVTHHIRTNLVKEDRSTKTGVLRAFYSREEDVPYIIDDCGDYWRCYRYIPNSITYDTCEDLDIICRAGEAFGRFQNHLKDFPAKSLFITIPDFHDTKKRFDAFHKALEENPLNRANKVKEEINALLSFEKDACILQDYLDCGKLPYRVTHNDTKCNNVSFDKDTGEALAVLDLDTVMPGAIAHDFGDAIRFIANTVIEDYPHVEDVALDLDKFSAFAKGFVGQIKDSITDLEKETLNLGVFAMTVELAVRFLTDYILGDKYFKTKYPGHNVDRARNQIALATDIKGKRKEMDEIVKKYL